MDENPITQTETENFTHQFATGENPFATGAPLRPWQKEKETKKYNPNVDKKDHTLGKRLNPMLGNIYTDEISPAEEKKLAKQSKTKLHPLLHRIPTSDEFDSDDDGGARKRRKRRKTKRRRNKKLKKTYKRRRNSRKK